MREIVILLYIHKVSQRAQVWRQVMRFDETKLDIFGYNGCYKLRKGSGLQV